MRPTEPSPVDLARRYQVEGYNAAVVARKLISQHGVEEAEATEVVGALFGTTKVDPRAGQTTFAALTGLALVAAGVLVGVLTYRFTMALPPGVPVIDEGDLPWGFVGALVLMGVGAKRVVLALVNARAKEDLRERRD
jgi:hypothetical protein